MHCNDSWNVLKLPNRWDLIDILSFATFKGIVVFSVSIEDPYFKIVDLLLR